MYFNSEQDEKVNQRIGVTVLVESCPTFKEKKRECSVARHSLEH